MELAQVVQHELRLQGYEKMQAREMAFFENHRVGETMLLKDGKLVEQGSHQDLLLRRGCYFDLWALQSGEAAIPAAAPPPAFGN